jgi:hypothetical protein
MKGIEPIILSTGKDGKYVVMSPNYEKGIFNETNQKIDGKTIHPFGFQTHIPTSEIPYVDDQFKDQEHNPEKIRLEIFKEFCNDLFHRARENGVTYILVRILKNERGRLHWILEADYQLMVES